MTGWRMSALPQAEKCGLAPKLHIDHPTASGRAALKGTAYHARASGDREKAAAALDVLTAAERAEVMSWPIPEAPDGAVRERPVGLTARGRFAAYGSDGVLTEGTLDVGWLEAATPEQGSTSVAVVGDYKSGVMPVEDGPLSLQLAAYGFAMADFWGAPAMRLGIWYARRGEWDWSPTILLDGEVAADLWRRVLYAASSPPVANPGVACETCWERGHCPERLLPALDGSAAEVLGPFMAGGPELTPARAAQGLRLIAAMRDVADRAEEQVRAAVLAGMCVEQDGKVYAPSDVAGRLTADVKQLEADGLTQYLRRGIGYRRWGWRRA